MYNRHLQLDPVLLPIQDALLCASLLCGMNSSSIIHRQQLFFCANFIVNKTNAEEDLQRSIETEANKSRAEQYWRRLKPGIYELTFNGYNHAKQRFSNVTPLFSPATKLSEVWFKVKGNYNGHIITIARQGEHYSLEIDNIQRGNREACTLLGLSEKTLRSPSKTIYNLAVKNGFKAIIRCP